MASFNQATIVGNITRDPELRYTPGGSAVCDITVAVNEKWKGKDGQAKEEVSFIDCTCWGRTAEVAAEHLKKGRSVLVSGRLRQDRWEDKNGGGKRSKIGIVVDKLQFLGGKGDAPAPAAAPDPVDEAVKPDENVPF